MGSREDDTNPGTIRAVARAHTTPKVHRIKHLSVTSEGPTTLASCGRCGRQMTLMSSLQATPMTVALLVQWVTDHYDNGSCR